MINIQYLVLDFSPLCLYWAFLPFQILRTRTMIGFEFPLIIAYSMIMLFQIFKKQMYSWFVLHVFYSMFLLFQIFWISSSYSMCFATSSIKKNMHNIQFSISINQFVLSMFLLFQILKRKYVQ